MPQIRMIGLVLFITTVLLALAAAATKTTHIRIQKIPESPAGSLLPDSSLPRTAVEPLPPLPERERVSALPPFSQPGHQPAEQAGAATWPFGSRPESAAGSRPELPVQFTSIPVTWPLLAAGGFGMLLWFWQPSSLTRKPSSSRRRRL